MQRATAVDDHVVDRTEDGTYLLYIDRHLVHEAHDLPDDPAIPVEGVAADPRYLDVWVPPGRRATLPVELERHAFAYVFEGSGTFRDASKPFGVLTEKGTPDNEFFLRETTGNRSLVLFDSGDEVFGFLDPNQTLVLTYTIAATDSAGAVTEQGRPLRRAEGVTGVSVEDGAVLVRKDLAMATEGMCPDRRRRAPGP